MWDAVCDLTFCFYLFSAYLSPSFFNSHQLASSFSHHLASAVAAINQLQQCIQKLGRRDHQESVKYSQVTGAFFKKICYSADNYNSPYQVIICTRLCSHF